MCAHLSKIRSMWRDFGKSPAFLIFARWAKNIIAALSRPYGTIWGRASGYCRNHFLRASWRGWTIFRVMWTRCLRGSLVFEPGHTSHTGSIGSPIQRIWRNVLGRWRQSFPTLCMMHCGSVLSTSEPRCCFENRVPMLQSFLWKSMQQIAFSSTERILELYMAFRFGLTRQRKQETVSCY